MPATFAPVTALNYVSQMIKFMPVSNIATNNTASNGAGNFLNDASNLIWMAAPWRWSIGVQAVSTITQGQPQTPSFTIPGSFLRLEKCIISNGSSFRELKPVGAAPPSPTITQWPIYAAVNGTPTASGTIQFDSLFPESSWALWFWYKKQAPIITSANYTTSGLLQMDDEWFWVFNEAALYFAYKYADDPRAGGSDVQITPQGPAIRYTGQLATVQSAIESMRRSETLVIGFPQTFPDAVKDH